eukprot:COSAG06_NODE_22403_length_724_cov_1.750400_2_plen_82_part_00
MAAGMSDDGDDDGDDDDADAGGADDMRGEHGELLDDDGGDDILYVMIAPRHGPHTTKPKPCCCTLKSTRCAPEWAYLSSLL